MGQEGGFSMERERKNSLVKGALHKKCRMMSRVPRAQRPDGTLNVDDHQDLTLKLSMPSGRCARGTLLLPS